MTENSGMSYSRMRKQPVLGSHHKISIPDIHVYQRPPGSNPVIFLMSLFDEKY